MFVKELFSRQTLIGNGIILLLMIGLVLWAEVSPGSMARSSVEDGPMEYLTAVFLALSCVGFLVVMRKSKFLREKGSWRAYVFVLAWALLMFVFAGEEISWGQRILGFQTPESVRGANVQGEFNVHNLGFMVSPKYRLLSLMMFVTGILLPGMALFSWGKRLFQRFAFPVLPLCYSGLFVGSYLFGKYYYYTLAIDAASETRELLMAVGMCAFAIHGAIRPDDLFRMKRVAGES